jgi:hypothetical protein
VATTTTNLKLTKPAASEAADISILNTNFDMIDALGGYGLGGAKKITDDIDTIVKPGWYWISASDGITIGGFSSADWYIRVDAYSSGTSYCVQHLYPLSSHKIELVRYKVKGTWADAEWVNPPMILGTEYRTTERYLGKPVYTKAVNFGALPNNSSKNVAHATGVDQTIIALDGVLSDGCHITSGLNRDRAVSSDGTITVDNTKWNIRVITNYDFSGVTATFIVKYIKE